ncbi:MAG: hypothetical protein V2I76_08415 [Roseobacter sp.]|nr:hypothetical protein [Roseobacter sp.]
MQDVKQRIMSAQAQDDISGDDAYDQVLNRLLSLTDERRGPVAVRVAARLLEFAAFELAGKIESGQVGAIIDCAAELQDTTNTGSAGSKKNVPEHKQTFH